MVLKLDPRFRLLWRTPSSLQFGLDRPSVMLPTVSEADERMIAMLTRGVSRSGLSMVCADAEGGEAEVEKLLDALAPVLLPETGRATARQQRVALHGTGRTADRIRDALENAGVSVDPAGHDDRAPRADFAIIVSQFVIEPELHGLWLRRDVPHLAVVFGDAGARIGPVVEPGLTPCLYCLERQRTDADPAWPALASQLWGLPSPIESALLADEVAALVGRYVVTRLFDAPRTGQLLPPATSLHLDAATGILSPREWLPHPACACLALPGNDSAVVRRGSSHSRKTAPRRDEAAAVPA